MHELMLRRVLFSLTTNKPGIPDLFAGAGEENRTPVSTLGRSCSAIEPRPHTLHYTGCLFPSLPPNENGFSFGCSLGNISSCGTLGLGGGVMEIKWIGHSCFRLQGKDIAIVTDPFGDEVGFPMPKVSCNILTVSHNHFDHNNRGAVSADIIFDTAGEFEFRGVRIRGIRTFHDEEQGAKRGSNLMFLFVIDGLKLLHCGDLGSLPSSEMLDNLGDIDVLFVPAGGNYTLPVSQAVELVHRLEPKIVVPMHFKVPGLKADIASAEDFVRRLGTNQKEVNTLAVSKNSLPEEEGTEVYILRPQAVKAAV